MQATWRKQADGAIVFDESLCPQVSGDWFVPDFWREHNALHLEPGGRGGIAVITTPTGDCVLRHYRRGGLIAPLLDDRYLWCGALRTRSGAEFHLLQDMVRRKLPVPVPVAARYVRHGLFYRADLITMRLAPTRTLAQCLAASALDAPLAEAVGAVVARFHRAGIWHADLNAHNVLVGIEHIYLIDFDRACQRPSAIRWQRTNLTRLRRSLLKLGAADDRDESWFDQQIWTPLRRTYEKVLQA